MGRIDTVKLMTGIKKIIDKPATDKAENNKNMSKSLKQVSLLQEKGASCKILLQEEV